MHRGKILQVAVNASGINKTLVARKAGYKRVTYYTHIRQKELSLEILEKYAKALGHDFSNEIPEMQSLTISAPETIYLSKPKNLPEALDHIEYWKNKYLLLLEKYLDVKSIH